MGIVAVIRAYTGLPMESGGRLRHYGQKMPARRNDAHGSKRINGGIPMPAGRHFLQIPGPTNVPDRV
ncbi:MAG: hypothetical protein OEX21_08325, partial [Betaproteobacteria bacterium]|nr:hypothetical protein [Betaproteobacteria bacterium]